ncbi:2'-5' RNA ligase family protein [Modestobacter muralis]|uniref:2'-5' RNA ligase family protein n=1 Tax=Modestobacter muralis TaxID=1608614 RepID=A0A6P0HD42_9ACTN|nr:2'-5' RNA ligase family protein [Modestobacter muralis]NEN52886.1 2'-5' RNA ligase family protein [Modestobacter muralis]
MTGRPLRADDTFVHRPGTAISAGTSVLGVVVALPEPLAQLMIEWRGKCGDPQASLVPPHVTLLPPTEVPIGERPAIRMHLEQVAATHPPFDVHLTGTGTFRPVSEVVFLTVARGGVDCELLAGAVRSGPLTRSLSFPYHPHVTVAHDVPSEMLDMAAEGLADLHREFRVESFTEFEQLPDGAWAVAAEYRLSGTPR